MPKKKPVAKKPVAKKPEIKTLTLPQPLVEQIAQYLSSRPFAEVAGLMNGLHVAITKVQIPRQEP